MRLAVAILVLLGLAAAAYAAETITYTYDGANTVLETVDVDFLRPVEPLGSLTFDAPLDAWEQNVPNIVLSDRKWHHVSFARRAELTEAAEYRDRRRSGSRCSRPVSR